MSNARLAAVGLFVLCGAVLALFTLITFGNLHPFRSTRAAEIVFDGSVSGLEVGAPVTFRGVPVGEVSDIAIEYDPRSRRAYIPVRITLGVGKVSFDETSAGARLSIRKWVADGLRAHLVPVNLISGQTEINLDFDPQVSGILHPGIGDLPEIPVVGPSAGSVVEQLSEVRLQELVANANLTLVSIQRLADSLSRGLPAFLHSATRSSTKAGQALDTAREALVGLQARTTVTLSSIDRLAASGERQINGRGADLHALLVSSNQAVIEARDALTNAKRLTADNSPARMNLEDTLSDLSAASASLRGFATDVEQNPRLLLTGRRP